MLQTIRLLLSVVSLLMKWADNATQQKIGEDRYVNDVLVQLAQRTLAAKQISVDVGNMSDTDIDKFLQQYYRQGDK